jgi:hypothetical protein
VSPDGEIRPIEAAMFDYSMRAGDGFPAEQMWHFAITDAPNGTHENIG